MKKILSLLSLAVLTVGLLGSCSKINERLDNLDKRVDAIENEQIASIESQIAGITSSIADLGTIRSDISSLKQSAENHSQEIFDLMDADEILENRILTLQNYLDDVLPTFAEKEWVEATFSTLEQYEATCDTIAKIDARIGALDAKLSKDIQTCADSLTKWVNKTFEGYYTAAQMDAKLTQMKSDIDSARAANKITDAKADSIAAELTKTKTAVDTAKSNIRAEYKAAIKSAIETSEGKLTKAINDAIATVNATITALTGSVSTLEAKVTALTGRVDRLEKMIQSVTIVPAYSDGSVEAINGILELNLIVSPSSAAKGLTKEKVKILLKTVATKAAGVDTVKVDKIKSFTVDQTKGTVEIRADISDKLNALQPKQLLTIAVNVKNGDLSDITTEFVTVDNTPGYTVKFNENYGDTPATRDTSVIKGGKINKPADPTREGWFFDKWFTKNQAQEEVEWNFTAMTVSQDTTLYAGWIQGKKVTFRKDTVNLTVCKDTIVRPNSTVNKPAVDPDSTGYAFRGWYTRKDDGTFDKEWKFDETNVTKDTTLFAKWAKVMTIAELLANNSKFPVSSSQDAIPDTAWVNGSNRCYYAQNSLVFKGDEKSTYSHDHELTRQDDGSYQDGQGTLTFVMDCDSVVKITLDRTSSPTELNGTYAPKSSIGGVQLWKDGPYFATCNVGADKPEDYGYYFWWGDTVGYKRNANNDGWVSVADDTTPILFSKNDPTATNTMNKANEVLRQEGWIDDSDNLVVSDDPATNHDAARAHLGELWRMMTKADLDNLVANCDVEWTNNWNNTGIKGKIVKGRGDYSANSIFLPAAGIGNMSALALDGSDGYYWSSTPPSSNASNANNLHFTKDEFSAPVSSRCVGHSVRAVRDAK